MLGRNVIWLNNFLIPQENKTPLFHACSNGKVEAAAVLLRAGARPDIQTKVKHINYYESDILT